MILETSEVILQNLYHNTMTAGRFMQLYHNTLVYVEQSTVTPKNAQTNPSRVQGFTGNATSIE